MPNKGHRKSPKGKSRQPTSSRSWEQRWRRTQAERNNRRDRRQTRQLSEEKGGEG